MQVIVIRFMRGKERTQILPDTGSPVITFVTLNFLSQIIPSFDFLNHPSAPKGDRQPHIK